MVLHPAAPQLADLDLLLSVNRLGSLGKAAREHGMSQPAASVRIQALERRLGHRLLERSPTGSRFTPAGASLARWAQRAVESVSQLMSCSAVLADGASGTLRVSASSTLAECVVPRWVAGLWEGLPDVAVRVRAGSRQTVVEDARAGQADLGFVPEPGDGPQLQRRVVAVDDLIVVVAPDHPWSRRRVPIAAEQLAAGDLVLRDSGFGSRRHLARTYGGVWPQGTHLELPSTAAVKEAALSGAGVAVLGRLAVSRELNDGRLVRVAVSGPTTGRRLFAVWDERTPLPAAAMALLDIATRELVESEAVRSKRGAVGGLRTVPAPTRAVRVASAS